VTTSLRCALRGVAQLLPSCYFFFYMLPQFSLNLIFLLMLATPDAWAQACLPPPPVNPGGNGPFDYTDPAYSKQARGVERNHFNQDVQLLRKGQTGAYVGSELAFILNYFPNHHRALDAMMRLADKTRKQRPNGALMNVECYLERATLFAPEDAVAKMLYGVHLFKLGKRKAALEQLTAANELRPDDRNIHYNLGLLYFEEKNYGKAKEHAKVAYDMSFPLEGLKKKLKSVGAWD
jgi:tetratricopeptide (TPR) repeat protein